jgi:hypothetical protein
MSKKYAVRGFGWKLAVAALAVAGVVGVVWAVDLGGGVQQQEMSVSFKVEISDTALLEKVKEATLDKAALLLGGTAAADKTGDEVGTLGILRVTTTSGLWDVTMKTLYGGKLVDPGQKTEDVPKAYHCPIGWTPNPWNSQKCQKIGESDIDAVPDSSNGTMRSLVYVGKGQTAPGVIATAGSGATDHDTVQLIVKIGICNVGSDLDPDAVQDRYYNLGAPGNYGDYLPVAISSGDLQDTRKYEATGGNATQVPLSFAEKIGGAYGTSGTSSSMQPQGTGVPQEFDWDAIETAKKFPKPITPNGRSVQHFFINVGLNSAATGNLQILERKDQNGTFGETFTFDLVHDLTI